VNCLGLGEPEDDVIAIALGKRLEDPKGYRESFYRTLHREFQKLSEKEGHFNLLTTWSRELC